MPTADTTLFSLNVLKDYVGVKGDAKDVQLSRLADSVTQRIEAFTGRVFVTRSLVQLYTPSNDTTIYLRHFPVTALTQVRSRQWVGDTLTVIPSTDYDTDLAHGVLYALWEPFPAQVPNGIEVTYSAGFGVQDAATLPQDVVQASLDWTKFLYQRQSANLAALTNITTSGSSISVGSLPKDIQEALQPWRKLRL